MYSKVHYYNKDLFHTSKKSICLPIVAKLLNSENNIISSQLKMYLHMNIKRRKKTFGKNYVILKTSFLKQHIKFMRHQHCLFSYFIQSHNQMLIDNFYSARQTITGCRKNNEFDFKNNIYLLTIFV